jgi:hypothetical protein
MKKFFSLLLLILSVNVSAQSVPLPTSVMGINEIVAEFRAVFVTKLSDLGKNYITTINENTLVYSSSEDLKCNGGKTLAGAPLGSIQYASKPAQKELYERVVYTGCNNEVSLVEETYTKGTNLKGVNFSEVIKGVRPVDLNDDETFKSFKISNYEGEVLFSAVVEKKGSQKIAVFTILGEKFLSMIYDYKSDSTSLYISPAGYNIKYIRSFSRWNSRNEFDPFMNTVIAKKGQAVAYLDNANAQQSLANFLKTFNKYVSGSALKLLNDFIEYHTYYFPNTEATKTGNLNQRFLEELRLAQNRIQSNTDITLVKNLIQNLITAAELGQILDNRPKN